MIKFRILFYVLIFPAILSAQYLTPQFGGEYREVSETSDCLSDEQRAQYLKECFESIEELKARGIIKEAKTDAQAGSFIWPVVASPGNSDFAVYGISGFIDHDPAYPNHLLDYNGGTRTYDLDNGYNHKGTDIFTWPYPWLSMDNSSVRIVAAKAGVITNKYDGYYDRNCGFGSDNWNAVYIRHDDGSVAWYGHMKKFSLTPKNVGETVAAGEYLGVVGSSGNSTGPHLHLEVYDSGGNLIDPWQGPSNPSITSSWWSDQKPYYEPEVNKIATHSTWPVTPDCPGQEIPNFKDVFAPGETLYLVFYYHDQLVGDQSVYTVRTPENIIFAQWSHAITEPHYAASWWGWSWGIASNPPLGTWKIQVSFHGNIYEKLFTVSNTSGVENSPGQPEFSLKNNYPNPFNPSTVINYNIPEADNVRLIVYNVLGQPVDVLVNEYLAAGSYNTVFEAGDLPGGVYFYTLSSGRFCKTEKMILAK